MYYTVFQTTYDVYSTFVITCKITVVFKFKIWLVLFVFWWHNFVLFKVNYLHCVLFKHHAYFLYHQISIIKCANVQSWLSTGNMFAYFCCGWFFRIIFTSNYFFNKRLKICINNRWFLIRFWLLIKLYYCIVFWRKHNTARILFSHIFIWI